MRQVSVAILLVLGMVFTTLELNAQRLTGSARLQVTDPTGASVPGVKATVVSQAKGTKIEVTGTSDGAVVLPDLDPGNYTVTLQHEGFKTVSTVVTVRVGITSSIPIKFEVGAVTTEVDVVGTEVTVDTSRSTVQNVIDAATIEDLPSNGRNFLDAAQLAPGVQVVDGGLFDPTKNQMTGVSVGGRSGRSTRIQVDGVDITDETVGTTVMNLTDEAIQEFGIQQANLDVSTDLTSSGAVNIITRSGSNAMHGSGFGFFRRSSFAANNAPIITSGTPKPPFSRDNYGGRLGGAIIKNKWFWEAEYEKIQQQGQITTNVLPFPQFTGSFGVPENEHMGGGRTDFNLTNTMKLFYRFDHDDNLGVTGFGGVGLSAFANSNNANSHVAGWDYGAGNWVHSVRFSFLKFVNGIVDGNALAGTPIFPAFIDITGLGGFVLGPNENAPQSTIQQDKQIKYDATFVRGKHTIQFGAEYNRIVQNGFASFFGLAPRINAPFSAGVAAVPFNANGASDPLNYAVSSLFIGNGLGALSEKSTFGFPHGGFTNNRMGIYLHDNWKTTRNLTLNGGLRYDRDDGLTNADLPRAPLIATFDPELGQTPRNDNLRLAPEAGFAWNVQGNGKTVIRGGGGIYYESNIFNNLAFDRVENLPPGFGNSTPNPTSSQPFVVNPVDGTSLFNFATQCTNAQPGTGTPNSCFGAAVGNVIPFALQAESALKAVSAQLATNWPPPGIPPQFNQDLGVFGGSAIVDPHYKSPYGAQLNIGVQHEIRPGLVLSVDYIMNRGVHFPMLVDRNRVGAANTLNVAVAKTAIATTLAQCGVTSIDAAIASCPALDPGSGATIDDFANNGLGGGAGIDGFAFSGNNPNFRQMTVIEPVGLSRYQGLQTLLSGRIGNAGPLRNLTVNVSYTLSRFDASSLDQDFLDNAVDNDNPTGFYGPSNLDRTHQIGATFLFDLPAGFHLSTTTIYRSNEPSTGMFLPGSNGASDIFEDDLNGDGSVLDVPSGEGDPLPGTNRGAYGRSVHASDLVSTLNHFNSSVAGGLTPAGIALVNAGLMTQAQLQSLGAVIPQVTVPTAGIVNNPNFYTTDLRLSWAYHPIERISIEPMVDAFNIFNRDNRVGQSTLGRGGNTAFDGILSGAPGSINGENFKAPQRVGSGSGSFSSGTPRAFQFGIRVSF